MIPIPLRALLIIGSLFAVFVVGNNIKKNRMLVEDSIFWMCFALVLFVAALFPSLIVAPAAALGFISPANFVFLLVIAFLLWRAFSNTAEISRLKAKVAELTQEIALAHMEEESEPGKTSESASGGSNNR